MAKEQRIGKNEHLSTSQKMFLYFMLFCALMSIPTVLDTSQAQSTLPNDPLYSEQWYLQPHADSYGTNWEQTYQLIQELQPIPQKPVIRIAVIDSGVNATHPELEHAIWTNQNEIANGFDDDNNGYVDDLNGCAFTPEDTSCTDVTTDNSLTQHGTGTTGLIASEINNQIGIATNGLGFSVEIIPIKVTQRNGVVNYSDIREALDYIQSFEPGYIDVVNMSFAGWPLDSSIEDMNQQISELATQGIIFVAGSGNSAETETSVGWPARHPSVIAVGGYTETGERKSNSNYGPELDLVAPAENIRTLCYEEDYCLQGGTSMASPQVALAAAYIRAYKPDASFQEVQALLQSSSGSEFDPELGYGPLNFFSIATALHLENQVFLPVITNN